MATSEKKLTDREDYDLLPYYERELQFIRQLAGEFAKKFPAAAGRLQLELNRSTDPHVERLIEAFALLAARVHNKIDDEFPELTDALLGVLYPHYLAPIPSMAIVQFVLDATSALPNGFLIDRHSILHTQAIDGLACRFRTGYPVTLWPVELGNARMLLPPFPANLRPPGKTAAMLRLQLTCLAGLKFSDLQLDELRFYLSGDGAVVSALYELLCNHTIQVLFRPLERDSKVEPIVLEPAQCLSQVGFERDESLLPYPNTSFLGYRLLTEFFAYPGKFWFLDLGGWQRLKKAGYGNGVEVVFFFNRNIPALAQEVDAATFRLGCTPVVNLFEQVAEPIELKHTRFEYRVVPDVGHQEGMEVYSVDAVTGTSPGSATTYEPFYSFRHGGTWDHSQTFWYPSRRSSPIKEDRGREVYLCWRMGEPGIRYWHGTDEGFAGRKPIDGDFLENHQGDRAN